MNRPTLKLRELDDRLTRFDPGTWDPDWILPPEDGTKAIAELRNALPALTAVIEAAENPNALRGDLDRALAALSAALTKRDA